MRGIRAALTRGVRFLAVAVALWLAGGTPAVATGRTSVGDYSSAEIIAALNRQREANGIPPVRNDPRMAAGCRAYDDYVLRNGLSVADQHFEIPGKPGFSAAGNAAAHASVLASSVGTSYPGMGPVFAFGWRQGDPWNNAAFHLFQMMNPALAVSGADERTARLANGQWVRLECLNTFGGPFRTPPATMRTYFYPRSGSSVPVRELNQEGASVLGTRGGTAGGPLFFAYFFGGARKRVRVRVHATVDGKSQPIVAVYAGGAAGPATAASAATIRDAASHEPSNPSAGFYTPEPAAAFREPEDKGPLKHLTPKGREVINYLERNYGYGAEELAFRGIAYP